MLLFSHRCDLCSVPVADGVIVRLDDPLLRISARLARAFVIANFAHDHEFAALQDIGCHVAKRRRVKRLLCRVLAADDDTAGFLHDDDAGADVPCLCMRGSV